MKIVGLYEGDKIDRLHLRLKSLDIAYDRMYAPVGGYFPGDRFTTEPATGAIVFEDTCELDTLIQALTDFRDLAFEHSGQWRRPYLRRTE